MSSRIKNRIEIIGFNDFWFIAIGSVVLSLITDFLFNNGSFFQLPFGKAMLNWSLSWFFCICHWMVMRQMMCYLRRRFPDFKDNIKRISLLLIAIVLTILVVDRIGSFVLGEIFGESYNHPSSMKLLVPVLLISIMTSAIYEAIYFYSRLQKFIREEEQAKQLVIEAQLDALMNQARPHFLFNSFNTLRDIIENDPKNNAINFVDKLSDVYRYILESGNVNIISLKEEIKFAQSYIHIQLERFGENLKIVWDVDEDQMNAMVMPMSLQLLLENAIKHNVVSNSKPLMVKVSIDENYLRVENKIQLKTTQLPSTKIGLTNIQKRYALVSKTPLAIINNEENFIVKLPLLKSKNN